MAINAKAKLSQEVKVMSVQNASLQLGATSMSVTGGTALAFQGDGTTVQNGTRISDTAATDLRLQKSIELRNRPSSMDFRTGKWSKTKRSSVVRFPVADADGNIELAFGRLEFDYPSFMSAADRDSLRYLTCQVGTDSDFATFHASGSVV